MDRVDQSVSRVPDRPSSRPTGSLKSGVENKQLNIPDFVQDMQNQLSSLLRATVKCWSLSCGRDLGGFTPLALCCADHAATVSRSVLPVNTRPDTHMLGLIQVVQAFSGVAHPVQKEIVQQVNTNKASSWVAEEPHRNIFANRSLDEIKGMMGLIDHKPVPIGTVGTTIATGTIPSSFDARTKWPSCKKPIRNQANCGSCWAFAAAETLTDNLCVLNKAPPVLSPQDLVSCDGRDHGCHGGTLPSAWEYIDNHGLVSDACVPYASGDGSNHTCPLPGCSGSGEPAAFSCPVKSSTLNSDEAIQAAVMTVGAVEVGFFVMADFMNYKSGVYSYQSGVQLGGHAVKVVGWGQDDGFYWIVQNSWGPSWGEDGYFRIRNWHDDKESAFAIGGGNACVQGAQPSPPAPAPAPSTCEDIATYCEHDQCADPSKSYLIPVCQKTCGCCGEPLKPDYCGKSK